MDLLSTSGYPNPGHTIAFPVYHPMGIAPRSAISQKQYDPPPMQETVGYEICWSERASLCLANANGFLLHLVQGNSSNIHVVLRLSYLVYV